MLTNSEINVMNARELVKEAEAQMRMFNRPSRNTSLALISMIKAQQLQIEQAEDETSIVVALRRR
jgi:hypothetical protein